MDCTAIAVITEKRRGSRPKPTLFQKKELTHMKSFKQYITKMDEIYTASNAAGLSTQDLGIVYRWLKWGNAAKTGLTKNNPEWEKQRDVIGSELGKRARKGEEFAKRALHNRVDKNVDKYGKPVPGSEVDLRSKPKKKKMIDKLIDYLNKKGNLKK